LSYFNFSFLDIFSKNAQIKNLMKIHPVGVVLLYADRQTDGRTDGRTDMAKLIVAFCNFSKAPTEKTGRFLQPFDASCHPTVIAEVTLKQYRTNTWGLE
jgi:hypothetical protein